MCKYCSNAETIKETRSFYLPFRDEEQNAFFESCLVRLNNGQWLLHTESIDVEDNTCIDHYNIAIHFCPICGRELQ